MTCNLEWSIVPVTHRGCVINVLSGHSVMWETKLHLESLILQCLVSYQFTDMVKREKEGKTKIEAELLKLLLFVGTFLGAGSFAYTMLHLEEVNGLEKRTQWKFYCLNFDL